MRSRRKHKLMVDGAKLTEARISAGMRLEDVVIALGDGCNRSSVSRWERGKLNPSEERVLKMIDIFKRGDFVLGGKQ